MDMTFAASQYSMQVSSCKREMKIGIDSQTFPFDTLYCTEQPYYSTFVRVPLVGKSVHIRRKFSPRGRPQGANLFK